MANEPEILISLARNIARRPQMYAATPEAAHGLLEAIAWIALHQSSGNALERCMLDVTECIKRATSHLLAPDEHATMLCDSSFPRRNPSFDAFRSNASEFLKVLEKLCG